LQVLDSDDDEMQIKVLRLMTEILLKQRAYFVENFERLGVTSKISALAKLAQATVDQIHTTTTEEPKSPDSSKFLFYLLFFLFLLLGLLFVHFHFLSFVRSSFFLFFLSFFLCPFLFLSLFFPFFLSLFISFVFSFLIDLISASIIVQNLFRLSTNKILKTLPFPNWKLIVYTAGVTGALFAAQIVFTFGAFLLFAIKLEAPLNIICIFLI